MAKGAGENDATGKLSGEIAHSREIVRRDVTGLRYELDFPRKLRRSFRTETVLWVSAAVAVGVLIAMLPARKKKIYVEPKIGGGRPEKKLLEAGFVLGALKIAATMLRPVIVDLIRTRVLGSVPKTPPRKW